MRLQKALIGTIWTFKSPLNSLRNSRMFGDGQRNGTAEFKNLIKSQEISLNKEPVISEIAQQFANVIGCLRTQKNAHNIQEI